MMSKEQALINRMVDGELGDEEQRALLADCERHSRWRELALAYVESQVLRAQLSSLATDELQASSPMPIRRTQGREATVGTHGH